MGVCLWVSFAQPLLLLPEAPWAWLGPIALAVAGVLAILGVLMTWEASPLAGDGIGLRPGAVGWDEVRVPPGSGPAPNWWGSYLVPPYDLWPPLFLQPRHLCLGNEAATPVRFGCSAAGGGGAANRKAIGGASGPGINAWAREKGLARTSCRTAIEAISWTKSPVIHHYARRNHSWVASVWA